MRIDWLNGRAWMISAGLLLVGTTSCQEKGYRTEVYPGPEGQTQIRRVPVDPTPHPAPRPVAPPADADLGTIQSLWPQLSPEDRRRVADMAKRLAESQK